MMAGIGAIAMMPFSTKSEGARCIRREPIDVTGKPTPPQLIKGEPRQRYFIASHSDPLVRGDDIFVDHRVFLDGLDVTERTSEVDITGQWVRMYDVIPDANSPMGFIFEERQVRTNNVVRRWQVDSEFGGKHFADFYEEKPKNLNRGKWVWINDPGETVSPEFIHFGHVEIR